MQRSPLTSLPRILKTNDPSLKGHLLATSMRLRYASSKQVAYLHYSNGMPKDVHIAIQCYFLMQVEVSYLWYDDVVKVTLLRYNGRTNIAQQQSSQVASASRRLFTTTPPKTVPPPTNKLPTTPSTNGGGVSTNLDGLYMNFATLRWSQKKIKPHSLLMSTLTELSSCYRRRRQQGNH